MRVLFLLLFITSSFFHSAFGQDSSRVRFAISTTVTEYTLLNFPIVLEKYYKKHTIGLTAAYRPSTSNGREIDVGYGGMPFVGYTSQNYRNPLYESITLGLNSKFFLLPEKYYVDIQVFYRYWWFDNKMAKSESREYSFDGLRSERQNVVGLKFLMGRTFVFRHGRNISHIIDMYAGTAIRYRTYRFETVDGYINDQYYTYKKETWSDWIPSIQFGVNIGLGIYK